MNDLPLRILLSERVSQALAASGESYWQIVARGTHPDMPGRWVIGLRPLAPGMAQEIEGILRGTHRAARIRPAKAIQGAAMPSASSGACHHAGRHPDAAHGQPGGKASTNTIVWK
jgi:hypothetical protein